MSYQKTMYGNGVLEMIIRETICMLNVEPSGIKLFFQGICNSSHHPIVCRWTQRAILGFFGLVRRRVVQKSRLLRSLKTTVQRRVIELWISVNNQAQLLGIFSRTHRGSKNRLAKRRLKIPGVKQNFTRWNYSMIAVP